MPLSRLDCVVLAGGVPRPGEPLHTETAGGPKALIDVAGRPMAQWVLDALAEAQGIGRVLLVGPPAVQELEYAGEMERASSSSPATGEPPAGEGRWPCLARPASG